MNLGKRLAIELFVATGVGAVLGLFGPFGSYVSPLAPRMANWMAFIVAGYLIFRPVIIVSGWLTDQTGIATWMARGIALALASLPTTFMVIWMSNGFRLGWPNDQGEVAVLYGQVLLIGLLINWLFHVMFGRSVVEEANAPRVSTPKTPSRPEPQPEPAFFARLPSGFGPLFALAGEDHYVRAYGEARDTLILIRLRDAIAELEAVEGMQVHRSWWVARSAIAGTERDGRNLRLILKSDIKVPVAREAVKALTDEGWL